MNIKKLQMLILLLLILSCSSESVKFDKSVIVYEKPYDITRLENFFKRSESDSVKAVKVLEKEKIIQHLTHLRKMDSGGKKYYLLEKADITEMINSVTEGIYLDYIMINKHGDIIYTKSNDALFGININNGYEKSPLKSCFQNRNGNYFEDVSYIAPESRIYSLYISSPVYVEGNFHGVLILQVDPKKISEIFKSETETEIFSRDGMIRVTQNEERLFTKYAGSEKIEMKNSADNGTVLFHDYINKRKFMEFHFKEINWIVVQKELRPSLTEIKDRNSEIK